MGRIISLVISAIGHCLCKVTKTAYIPIVMDCNGLGNRIKALANFYQLGYRKLIVLWNTTSWVTDSFNHLFYLDGCRISEFNSFDFGYNFYKTIFRRFLPLFVVKDETPYWSFILPKEYYYEEFKHKWSFCDKPTYSIDFKYGAIPEDIRELYRPFFKALQPSKLVKERIESCSLPSNVIGVQIRNTGLKEDKKDVCSLETICKAMERMPKDSRFFVSAMNAEVSAFFKAQFHGRILELPNKQYSSMIDAVADMWLLGRCSKMIVSPGSTFSEVAWWWGGAKSSVIHLQSEFNQANA